MLYACKCPNLTVSLKMILDAELEMASVDDDFLINKMIFHIFYYAAWDTLEREKGCH